MARTFEPVVSDEEQVVVRSKEEIDTEIMKVLKAKDAAERKIVRCDKILDELSDELQSVSKK